MRVSDIGQGHAGRLVGQDRRLFVVTVRDHADRSSGVTKVTFEDGGQAEYIWDYEDPEAEYVGPARLETRIVLT